MERSAARETENTTLCHPCQPWANANYQVTTHIGCKLTRDNLPYEFSSYVEHLYGPCLSSSRL